jgi:hypothetical protein
MPTGTWVITSARGGDSGGDLLGCNIVGTSTGYAFRSAANSPDRGAVLASSTSLSAPINFNFTYQGWDWYVTINNLTPRPSGSWSNNAPNSEGGIGTWESGVGEEEDEGKENEKDEEEDAESDYSAT